MRIKKLLFIFTMVAVILSFALNSAEAGYYLKLNHWTKKARVFSVLTLDAKILVYATLLSDEMISAQRTLSEKKGVEYKNPPITGTGFFVSMATHKSLKKFSMNDDSVWKAYLVGADGTEIPATKIEPVNITATEDVFYPYMNRWSKAYYVDFPATELGSEPKFILRSIAGETEMKWKIK